MLVPLVWLDHLCGGRVDRARLAGWLREAGADVGEVTGDAVEVVAPPGLGHLASVPGLAAELRGRLGGGPPGDLPVDAPVLAADSALEVVQGRLVAAVVVLPGEVRVPEPQAGWLTAAGVPLTGTVADVLALVEMETGQPVHAADSASASLDGLGLRPVADGEEVDFGGGPGDLVVADGERVLAVPGRGTAALPDCREVVVHSWWLPPEAMRHVLLTAGELDGPGRRLACGLPSAGSDLAVSRAVELLAEWAGAEVKATAAGGVLPPPRPEIVVTEADLRATLGGDVSSAADLLTAVGIPACTEQGMLRVVPPFWRADLTGARVLAGEIARLRGYGSIPVRLPAWDRVPRVDPARALRRTLRDAAVRWGLQQVSTPVLRQASDQPTSADPIGVRGRTGLRNLRVRDSLLPPVLDVATRSLEHTGAAHHFEVGPVPRSTRPGDERWCLAAVIGGALVPPSLVDPEPRAVAFADLVGLVAQLGAGRGEPELVPEDHPGLDPSFTVVVGGAPVGRAGMAGPDLYCVDLDLEALGALPPVRREVRLVPPVPLPAFNVTVVLEPGQSAREVLDLVAEAGGTRRDLVRVRDVFQGERLGPGRTSLTIRAEFDRTGDDSAKAEGRRRREAVLSAVSSGGWDCR